MMEMGSMIDVTLAKGGFYALDSKALKSDWYGILSREKQRDSIRAVLFLQNVWYVFCRRVWVSRCAAVLL